MHRLREALRERRIAAESLANACLPHIDNPAPALRLVPPVDPHVPEDWRHLLERMG